jgi:hypothetical protein
MAWLGVVCPIVLIHAYQQQREARERAHASQTPTPPPATTRDDETQRSKQASSAQDEPVNWYEAGVAANWALVIVGAITFVVIGWQAWETRRYAQAAAETVVGTAKTASAAENSAIAAADTLATNKIIERAYVDISHDQPGLMMKGHSIRFSLAVKNHGRTPAYVSNPQMTLVLQESDAGVRLPRSPRDVYGQPKRSDMSAFLMPNEAFHSWELRPQFPRDVIRQLRTRDRTLWLIGFLDYIDQFGRSHRAGYARRYIPTPLAGTRNNLVFELQPGYNYDVEIDEEGHPKNQP